MLPRTPPEWVLRPSLEKVASRTLPQTLSCDENTAPGMLFTLRTGYLQAHFWLHFGSLLGTFGAQNSPKRRKRGLPKRHQKNAAENVPKGHQNELQKGVFKNPLGTFFASLEPSSPRMGLRPHFNIILGQKNLLFHKCLEEFCRCFILFI